MRIHAGRETRRHGRIRNAPAGKRLSVKRLTASVRSSAAARDRRLFLLYHEFVCFPCSPDTAFIYTFLRIHTNAANASTTFFYFFFFAPSLLDFDPDLHLRNCREPYARFFIFVLCLFCRDQARCSIRRDACHRSIIHSLCLEYCCIFFPRPFLWPMRAFITACADCHCFHYYSWREGIFRFASTRGRIAWEYKNSELRVVIVECLQS